ncbi:MAG TPA: aldehyde dehydrogenase family protein, partial [Acidilobales archaeon]|nr:aldehyde dehydrogenase family protein [Acidilobales archaeon]
MKKLKELKSRKVEMPLIIGGKKVKSGELGVCRCPHNHSLILGYYHKALEEHVEKAIDEALKAWDKWANMDWYHRAMIFLKAAELLAGPYRFEVNAAIMLCQSKTPREAE